jgi:hypothetical protein
MLRKVEDRGKENKVIFLLAQKIREVAPTVKIDGKFMFLNYITYNNL